MKKIYVLDTNVLIHDPESIFKFEENDVLIPLAVVRELDHLKSGQGEVPYSARHALRLLDGLRKSGDLVSGVPTTHPEHNPSGDGTLKILRDASAVHVSRLPDDVIIESAMSVKATMNGGAGSVILVSKDTAVRVKAEALGIDVEDYLNDKTSLFQKYGDVLTDGDHTNGILSVRYFRADDDIFRLVGHDQAVPLKPGKQLSGIEPKNVGQRCVIDALTNPDIEVVALTGSAGTGKTLLALAAGIHQSAKRSPLYDQVLVARPVMPMGNDLGYLPGDVSEKLAPWMQPIFDNLEVIVHTPKGQNKDNASGTPYKSYQYLVDAGLLAVEALTYIRGRSLPRRYFIIDEAQNLRPLDVKTIITRCGEGTKVVFTGDMNQIDSPYLDKASNGLAYLISRFINEEFFCYLNLRGSVRSKLAERAAELL